MQNEFELKKQICEIGKRIYNRNMVAANDGNISVKLNDNEFLCTPTGVSKGFMTPEYICKVDAKGNVIQANAGFKPSSEIKMHMRVYEKRPDVGSCSRTPNLCDFFCHCRDSADTADYAGGSHCVGLRADCRVRYSVYDGNSG